MAHIIVKPVADDDFYVVYSTVLDSPVKFGNRQQILSIRAVTEEVMTCADREGTSARWGEPLYLGWADEHIRVRENIHDPERGDAFWGAVKRTDLRALCDTFQDGVFYPTPNLVTWEEWPDE